MAGIALQGVTKRFPGDVVAVDDVTLAIEDGEFMVLVGPSGCGKSTLLRMIAGLEEVSEGAIAIGERDVTTLEPKQRDIAMVFQNYALYPHMTVERNLSFGLRLRRTPKAVRDKRVTDVARTLGLHDLLQRRPSALSGGQRQRVAMGRAMVREPQAFLMDEPLSNLDAKLRVQMRAELARLHTRLRTTTVYVTHDQVEAMTLGTRVAVLRSGVLQQVDTPQNLYRRPRNLFVAAFIGSPSMNLVEARIEGGAARFAGYALPLAARPVLAALEGRSVVLGLRPAAFEDARLARASGWPTIDATAEVVEDLGDAMHVIFAIDAPPVLTEDVTAAAEDEEGGALVHDEGGPRAVFVARVDAASAVTAGEPVRLAIDPAGLHAFDAATGDSLLAE